MDHVQQAASSIPHIVQVYQSSSADSKLQNQQVIHLPHTTATPEQDGAKIVGDPLQIPATSHLNIPQHLQITPNPIMMACPQTHLQNVQSLHSQMLQGSQMIGSDMSSLQIASHVLLPSHLLMNSMQQSYFNQFEEILKNSLVSKQQSDLQMAKEEKDDGKSFECTMGTTNNLQIEILAFKRTRSQLPNPNKWACNIRKAKHQRGEAYISRRGKFVPEKHVRNTKDCRKSCKYKCNERIGDEDRENIFKAFYSLNTNEKRHFLLNTTERNYVKNTKFPEGSRKRQYSFKYFFLVRGVKNTVCKNFYLGTLDISQKPVYNVHLGKSEMNIPKPDGRGLAETSNHSLPCELKDGVRRHIMSFKTVASRPVKQFSKKKQYLDADLSVKQMYTMYLAECSKEGIESVKESMYRKMFRKEFNLDFKKLRNDQLLCCKCKEPIKK